MFSILTFTTIWASAVGLAATQSIDPSTVSSGTRDQWCTAQTTQCPLICAQYPGESPATAENNCDSDTLVYSCICEVNGLSPNISEYSQTIPYFVCTESNNNCVTNCNGDSACQSKCREDNACGAQNPTRVNETDAAASTTTTGVRGAAASTAADGAVYTGFGSSDSGSSGDSGAGTNAAAVLLDIGQVYGLCVVSAGMLAGFSFLL